MLKVGRKFEAESRHFGVDESTVRYIAEDEANIRKTAAITLIKSAKRVVTDRNKTIDRMVSVLAVWLADCRRKNVALDMNNIRTKAMGLYDTFAAKEPEDDIGDHEETGEGEENVKDPQPGMSSDSSHEKRQFSANKRWFVKFQKRYGPKKRFPAW